jgi:hypothetical protein
MQEYEKYGNNCMQIAKVLSTQTPAQIKKHAECFFKQNLKTNSKHAARTTRPTSVLDSTKPIGERGKNSRLCLIVSQAAYLITRITDIGLPGRAAREPIWSQYFPPLSNLCW